jgi:membrane-associated protein
MDVLHPTLPVTIMASVLSPDHILTSVGTIGLIVIIFLESCFAPLPGDSLLFAAGLFASDGRLNLPVILIGTGLAATLGNQVGYWFGRKAGTTLYRRPNSKIFKADHLEKTHVYFEKYGPKTILIARVIPIVRGLAPIVAGVGRMDYRKFTLYNVSGGIVWVCAFAVGGWFLGKRVHNVDHYVLPLTVLVVIVTSIPTVIEYFRARNHFRAEAAAKAAAKDAVLPDDK